MGSDLYLSKYVNAGNIFHNLTQQSLCIKIIIIHNLYLSKQVITYRVSQKKVCFRNEQLAALQTTLLRPPDNFMCFFLTGRPLDFNRSAPQKISKTHFFLGHPVHTTLLIPTIRGSEFYFHQVGKDYSALGELIQYY